MNQSSCPTDACCQKPTVARTRRPQLGRFPRTITGPTAAKKTTDSLVPAHSLASNLPAQAADGLINWTATELCAPPPITSIETRAWLGGAVVPGTEQLILSSSQLDAIRHGGAGEPCHLVFDPQLGPCGKLPMTGANHPLVVGGAALAVLLAGWLLLPAKHSRREEDQQSFD